MGGDMAHYLFNAGFLYRTGEWIKNFGERLGRIPVLGLLLCGPIISIGLGLKTLSLKRSVK
jgi:hypothetical protein